jgi:hypothetical protein
MPLIRTTISLRLPIHQPAAPEGLDNGDLQRPFLGILSMDAYNRAVAIR